MDCVGVVKISQADYLHMWWSYPVIFKFWINVKNCIYEITKVQLSLCPRVMLLLDFEFAVVVYKPFLVHLLTAASLLTAKFWKAKEMVAIEDWIRKANYIGLIRKLTAVTRCREGHVNAVKEFEIEWECFFKSRFCNVQKNIREFMLTI